MAQQVQCEALIALLDCTEHSCVPSWQAKRFCSFLHKASRPIHPPPWEHFISLGFCLARLVEFHLFRRFALDFPLSTHLCATMAKRTVFFVCFNVLYGRCFILRVKQILCQDSPTQRTEVSISLPKHNTASWVEFNSRGLW